jgi:hypothetical protein
VSAAAAAAGSRLAARGSLLLLLLLQQLTSDFLFRIFNYVSTAGCFFDRIER